LSAEPIYLLVLEPLGLFDMPPLEELPELPDVPELLLLPLEEPVLDPVVLLGECEELDEPPAALPCDALNSSRLSLPSWSLSSWSNDLLLLEDDDPPEAALLSDDEDDGVLVLLCDADGDLELELDCFDVSLAYADAMANAASEKASATDFSCMNYLLVIESRGTRVRARQREAKSVP